MKRACVLAALVAALLLDPTREAHAYLDPGTGSMLLQGLIGGIAAASVAIGAYWSKLKALFFRPPAKKLPRDGARDATERQ